jgi:nitrite reductase (NADH) large subunit
MKQKLVVIGAGMASGRVLESLTELAPDAFDITLFNAEPRGNYNRIMLSPVLSGEKTYAEIVTHDEAWYATRGVKTVLGHAVTKIDRDAKTVTSAGVETQYDQLIIATGSAPFIIPVQGHKLPGVVTYRDLEDTNAMIAAAKRQW